ncbi:MAG: isoprenylcysteine carboxylmethyltransferase family protein [Alphaproteobacteria bacterium]|nr:MAG: isoprenylcysteine carboxylmethyltransferase family protein [Alphaproteobacteria bacterium]
MRPILPLVNHSQLDTGSRETGMPINLNPNGALARGWQGAQSVDFGERLILLLFFGWFLSHILPSVADHPYNMLILVSETLTALLVLVRRPGPMATSFYAWAIAILGTCAPLLVLPTSNESGLPVAVAAGLMVAGLMFSLAAKGFLRRSFGIVAASRGVRRGGPYRLVRHPMYAGYIVTQIGFLLINPSLWNAAVYALSWTMQVMRIGEEEKILSRDAAYRDYQADVRYRLIPGLY